MLHKFLQLLSWFSRFTTSILLLSRQSSSRDFLHIAAYPSSHRLSMYCSVSLAIELLVCFPFTRPPVINANRNRFPHHRSPSCIYNGLRQSALLRRQQDPLHARLPNHQHIVHVPLPCPQHWSTTNLTSSPPSHFPQIRSSPPPTRCSVTLRLRPLSPLQLLPKPLQSRLTKF